MITISLKELKQLIDKGLTQRGLSHNLVHLVSEPIIYAEIINKRTHGIYKLENIGTYIKTREKVRPEIIKEGDNYALINGHKELGYITADYAIDVLIKKTKNKKTAIAVVGVINSTLYAMLRPYAEKIANNNLIAILMNNSGPPHTVAFGGTEPVSGTNPIAIGIPSVKYPIILDMATSERPYGDIRLARKTHTNLLPNLFFDQKGKITTDPNEAIGLLPFGGKKGFGLNFMIEILTGVISNKMGRTVKNHFDMGWMFIAIDPSKFSNLNEFKKVTKKYIRSVQRSKKADGIHKIYIPGERSQSRLNAVLKRGAIKLSLEDWNFLLHWSKNTI